MSEPKSPDLPKLPDLPANYKANQANATAALDAWVETIRQKAQSQGYQLSEISLIVKIGTKDVYQALPGKAPKCSPLTPDQVATLRQAISNPHSLQGGVRISIGGHQVYHVEDGKVITDRLGLAGTQLPRQLASPQSAQQPPLPQPPRQSPPELPASPKSVREQVAALYSGAAPQPSNELEALRQEVAQLKSNLFGPRTPDGLQQQLDRIETQLGYLNDRLDGVEQRLAQHPKGDRVREWLGGIWHQVSDTLSSWKSQLLDKSQQVKTALLKIPGQVKLVAGDLKQTVTEKAGDTKRAVSQAAVGVKEAVTEKVGDASRAVKQQAANAVIPILTSGLSAAVQATGQQVENRTMVSTKSGHQAVLENGNLTVHKVPSQANASVMSREAQIVAVYHDLILQPEIEAQGLLMGGHQGYESVTLDTSDGRFVGKGYIGKGDGTFEIGFADESMERWHLVGSYSPETGWVAYPDMSEAIAALEETLVDRGLIEPASGARLVAQRAEEQPDFGLDAEAPSVPVNVSVSVKPERPSNLNLSSDDLERS
jgi:hypothetical protein